MSLRKFSATFYLGITQSLILCIHIDPFLSSVCVATNHVYSFVEWDINFGKHKLLHRKRNGEFVSYFFLFYSNLIKVLRRLFISFCTLEIFLCLYFLFLATTNRPRKSKIYYLFNLMRPFPVILA